jgi:hypothetical protein
MFIVATAISVVFSLVKFIEMRFINKENKPLKFLIRDSLIVYFSVLVGLFILEQLTPILQNSIEGGGVSKHPFVFTDKPDF